MTHTYYLYKSCIEFQKARYLDASIIFKSKMKFKGKEGKKETV